MSAESTKLFSFSALSLSKPMLHNLQEIGFETMTPVQAESLPPILENRDVIAQAKTGSGKTAAFGIGLLYKLDVKKFRVQALILCPTRELADQVAKELRRLARFTHNIKILTLCGGMAFGPQLGSLRHQAHIIVGTPGRVLKHLNKGSLALENLETLVLDEADRMLDMGFSEEINQIIDATPKKRQTLLFSATYPEEILKLSQSVQKNAVNIQTISSEPENRIEEYFYPVSKEQKISALIRIFAHHQPENVIIFSNTKVQSEEIAGELRKQGMDALALHGDLEQYERNDVLVQFSNRSCPVLVATDVAARGLDIDALGMVVNYDLPHDATVYTHRIGRTGRAGKQGVAITLFTDRQAHKAEAYRNETRVFAEKSFLRTLQKNLLATLQSPNATLVIEGGKKEKVRPGDILGGLPRDEGIDGKSVGKIDIYDRQSYVAIERGQIQKACSRLKQGKIKGRKFSVWVMK